MKAWNVETRNERGEYYRRGDWSVELPEGHKRQENFTTVPPPAGCMREVDPVPCDWSDGEWVIDQEAKAEVDLKRDAELRNELDQWRLMEILTRAVWQYLSDEDKATILDAKPRIEKRIAIAKEKVGD